LFCAAIVGEAAADPRPAAPERSTFPSTISASAATKC